MLIYIASKLLHLSGNNFLLTFDKCDAGNLHLNYTVLFGREKAFLCNLDSKSNLKSLTSPMYMLQQ